MVDGISMFGAEVIVARNDAPERGPFSSLLCGLDRAGEGAAYVLPIDVPCPGRAVWTTLARAVEEGGAAAVPVHAERSGHPVFCSAALTARLARVPVEAEDARLDVQLRALGDAVRRIEVDDVRVGMNLNTRRDFADVT
jgi:CTP:molybdopterin cytidylyltransferase MocA